MTASPFGFISSEQPVHRRPAHGPAVIGPTLLAPAIRVDHRSALYGAH